MKNFIRLVIGFTVDTLLGALATGIMFFILLVSGGCAVQRQDSSRVVSPDRAATTVSDRHGTKSVNDTEEAYEACIMRMRSYLPEPVLSESLFAIEQKCHDRASGYGVGFGVMGGTQMVPTFTPNPMMQGVGSVGMTSAIPPASHEREIVEAVSDLAKVVCRANPRDSSCATSGKK